MARPARTGPELLEISPPGRLAGRTIAVMLVVSAFALLVTSWDELWRRCGAVEGRCVERAAAAGLLALIAVGAIAAGVATWIRVGRRPVDAEGSSRYVWALAVMFALGMVLIAARIPAFTCERGRFDDALTLCMHPPSTSEPARWLVPKRVLVGTGILGGVVIALTPRLVRIWMVLAILAWSVGFGWTVVENLAAA